LQGGASPLQTLNQQYVATKLNILVASGPFGSVGLTSALRCFGLNFTPVQLSNGFTISRNTTLGEVLTQTRNAIISNRTGDMTSIATILALLNGSDPTNRCQ
jgi:hypothetical protein